jgi:hypothetical protein
VIKDCALASIATGRRAQDLRELRDHIAAVDLSSIYHHFWGCLMRPRFDDPEYNNDIAAWVAHALQEYELAERLAVIDPAAFAEVSELQRELLDVIEDHLDQTDHVAFARRQDQFHFRMAQIVVFDTGRRLERPEQLAETVPGMSLGSIFYHFIDARRRSPELVDDFRAWLAEFGENYRELVTTIASVDPYFTSLKELRATLAAIFRQHLRGTTP